MPPRTYVRLFRFSLALCASVVLAAPIFAGEITKTLADGVVLRQIIQPEGPDVMVVNVLQIETKNPNVKIEAALAGGAVLAADLTIGRETISRLTARTGALAAVNADFFPYTGDPLGISIVNGDLVSEPYAGRSAIGISRGGWVLFDKLGFSGQVTSANGAYHKIHGVNRSRGANEMICYSPVYGAPTPSKNNNCVEAILGSSAYTLAPNTPIQAVVRQVTPGTGSIVPPDGFVLSGSGESGDFINNNLRVGDKVTLRFDIISNLGKNWTPVAQAVGGGPWLVRNGQIAVEGEIEKFDSSLINNRHPRTAVGMTAKKELLLVTVDGRQWISRGMTLPELARLMQSLGAVTAINLDGGGSTTMSVKGMVVNSPCEGVERAVANALLVRSANPAPEEPGISFAAAALTAQAGVAQKLVLIDTRTSCILDQKTMSRVVWGVRGGKGFVNQWGLFVPLKVGSGAIIASLGDNKAEVPVTVTTGAPNVLTASMKPDIADPNRGVTQARVADKAGNPVPGQTLVVAVIGGIADVTQAVTDASGTVSIGVTWDAAVDPTARQVTVCCGTLTPVMLTYKPKQ